MKPVYKSTWDSYGSPPLTHMGPTWRCRLGSHDWFCDLSCGSSYDVIQRGKISKTGWREKKRKGRWYPWRVSVSHLEELLLLMNDLFLEELCSASQSTDAQTCRREDDSCHQQWTSFPSSSHQWKAGLGLWCTELFYWDLREFVFRLMAASRRMKSQNTPWKALVHNF